jgi:type III pantothenate kinase
VTPDIVVDVGNSRIKWGRIAAEAVVESVSLLPNDVLQWTDALKRMGLDPPVKWAMAGVHQVSITRFHDWACKQGPVTELTRWDQLPLEYQGVDPQTVGIDRLLDAVSAISQLPQGLPCVVIDAGTAVTVDLIDCAHRFAGGAILPGPRLMSASLHQYTNKLPDIQASEIRRALSPGQDTESAIRLGIWAALLGGCQQLITEYCQREKCQPRVIITGGARGDLSSHRFTNCSNIVVEPNLTLLGILHSMKVFP